MTLVWIDYDPGAFSRSVSVRTHQEHVERCVEDIKRAVRDVIEQLRE